MLSGLIDSAHSYPAFTLLGKNPVDNWYTSGTFLLVLSYKEEILSILYRLHWIWTELSHDVLNPAHVPLSWANSPTLGTYYRPRMR